MSILDTTVTLSERDSQSIKLIMGEVGSGKTSFLKDMPDAVDGNILYIPIGNDLGFNQLKSDKRFRTLPQSVKTVYATARNGKKVAISKRALPMLIEVLEAFRDEEHDFGGLTIDAISTLQEVIETEIKFEKNKNMDWDDWAAIKKGMFRVYEVLEEICELGYHVALQSHFQIRDHEDTYSGEKMSRTLPMMTENNAIRILKNADAVVFIKLMANEKDSKLVDRMTIVGGHPSMPTKIRNDYNLSFDGILFKNLTYGGLIKLMEVDSLDNIEGTESLENVEIKREGKKDPKALKAAKKKAEKATSKKAKESKVEEKTEETEKTEEVVTKTTRKPGRKPKKPKGEKVEEPKVEETKVEEPVTKKPKKGKKPKKANEIGIKEDELPVDMQESTSKKPKKKRPKKTEEVEEVVTKTSKKPNKKKPKKVEEVEEPVTKKPKKGKKKKPEDKLGGDGELVNDELFD